MKMPAIIRNSLLSATGILILAGASQSAATAAEPLTTPNPEERIRTGMQKIVIPRLEFRDATAAEALDFLNRKISELAPDGKPGPSIVLPLEMNKKEAQFAPELVKSTPIPAKLAAPLNTRITVVWTNISLYDATSRVASMAGVRFRIIPTGIQLVPGTVIRGTQPRKFTTRDVD